MTPEKWPADGRQRATIDAVLPAIDGGRFPVKCVLGEPFHVEAHCFADGHDSLRVMLRWRASDDGEAAPHEVEMRHQGNDVWLAHFTPSAIGLYTYTVHAWVDHFLSWRTEMGQRIDIDDIRLALRVGAGLIDEVAQRTSGADQQQLSDTALRWREHAADPAFNETELKACASDEAVLALTRRYPDREHASQWDTAMPLVVDRLRARYGAWYELFPRSASPTAHAHGTLADVMALLPYIAGMGFDVLYLPPIHPIGKVRRKGINNAEVAQAGDVGCPWAIGSEEGGHKALHPLLGSTDDFLALTTSAARMGIEVALDIAFQCAPDHPYVESQRTWFRWRPDGSVQYAENPPKKYQDIYPFHFESEDWQALWQELRSIFEFWIQAGVRIFRVDNPHTKPFAFWEWVIHRIKADHPDTLFLSEAFTRPKVMHRLAKLGFTQSYTYFTWRQTGDELKAYFNELSQGPGNLYFRPNVWPNTPDILHEQFHHAGRPTFALRLVLAATLSPSYGIYGPAYELMENRPREPHSEEYLDSEKYQLRHWSDLNVHRSDSLAGLIAQINAIRRAHPALQSMDRLTFLETDNKQLLAYVRQSVDGNDVLVVIVNLDPLHAQSGWLQLDPSALGLHTEAPFEVHDLLSGRRFSWQGMRHFILLDPVDFPAHVLHVPKPSLPTDPVLIRSVS